MLTSTIQYRRKALLKSINQLKERFLDHVDIDPQNIFTLDGSVAQERSAGYLSPL